MSEIGDNIARKRYEMGMSQSQLAQIMGYKSRSTISRIEAGENDVPQNRIKDFAEALNTTVAELIGIDEKEGKEVKRTYDDTMFRETFEHEYTWLN
ncbi:MAG: helix-turn-helix transcriptional regulator, partial [Lentihominibacter sp.]|nr:helix-turn-helix transcriptional regulator [Lentihominibacter sp.]